MHNIIDNLIQLLGTKNVITDPYKKANFEIDWRKKYVGKAIAVVFPNTVTDIQQIIILSQKYNIKITIQGGNTSTCGGAVPATDNNLYLIVNLCKLNKIIEIDHKNFSMQVEAGCTLEQVIQVAKENNLYFPLNIASKQSCQIGGNIATNAGGMQVLKYGTMKNLVLGLEVILPNAKIINQLKKLRKHNMNFDLKQLFIGSEGTLGIITQANLALFPYPQNFFTLMFGVNTLTDALNILNNFKKNYYLPSTFEIINENTQELYNNVFSKETFPIKNSWLVICELENITPIDENKIINILTHNNISLNDTIIASSDKERQKIWNMRENIPIAEKNIQQILKYDIALPISELEKFIQFNQKNLYQIGINKKDLIVFGHLGDGNLHYNINTHELKSKIIDQISKIIYDDVIFFNGSISAEHGIGQSKTKWFKSYCDTNSYELFKNLKQLIDPQNIFNNKVIFYK